MTKIIGHRGLPTKYNDNSIIGINEAQKYCSAVEIDLRLTYDNEILLFHDPFIDGKEIASFRLHDLINEFPEKGLKDHHLTSRSQLGSKPIFFEIKTDLMTHSKVRVLKEKTLRLSRSEDTVICFDWEIIFDLKGNINSNYGIHIENRQQMVQAEDLSLLDKKIYFLVKADLINNKDFNLPNERVVAWTVNDIDLAKRLIELRISGIITDRPEQMQRLTI